VPEIFRMLNNYMDILIINNQTKHLRKLKELVKKENVFVIKPNDINLSEINKFDFIILSGSLQLQKFKKNNFKKDNYSKEIELVKTSKKPILGICFGLKLIAYAFGRKSEKLSSKRESIVEIKVIKKDRILKNISNFKAYEAHNWVLKKLPDNFIGLAKSKDGWEIIKHKKRMLYGFQFHPEIFTNKTLGSKIFYNFLNLVKQKL